MKKIIGLLLALVIICSVTCVVLAKPEGASISVVPSSTEVALGDEVTFTVSLQDAAVAKSASLAFSYDSGVFDVVSGEWALTGAMLSDFKPDKNAAAIAYTSATDINGTVFTLKLQAKDNATVGNTTVSVTPTIKNGSTVIDCADDSATVTIKCKNHVNGEPTKENVSPATCGVDGSYDEVVRCTVCGAVVSSTPKTEPATGNHTAGEPAKENVNPATCGVDGSYDEVVKCTVCGQEISRTPKTELATGEHTKGEPTKENVVSATCAVDGSYDEVVYCTVCGQELSRTPKTELATGEHKAGEPTKENVVSATCGADGSYDAVVKCTVCGKELSRTPKTELATGEHNYVWVNDNPEAHWQECADCHSMPEGTESEAHTFEYKTIKEPTTTEEGEKEEVCTVCGYKTGNVEKIDKLIDYTDTEKVDYDAQSAAPSNVISTKIPGSKLSGLKVKITINGKVEELTSDDFDVVADDNGNAKVTLKPAYLNKLANGSYKVEIVPADGLGVATSTVTVANSAASANANNNGTASTTTNTDNKGTTATGASPKTSDTDIAFLVIALLAVMGSSVFAGVTYRRKRNSK